MGLDRQPVDSNQGDQAEGIVVSHRLYSARELSDLLVRCGFVKVRVFGDLAGTDYDHNAKRLVVLAQR